MNFIAPRNYSPPPSRQPLTTDKIVVIGASTGGPQALITIFHSLPADLSIPIVVAQHMLPKFIQPLVNSISRETDIPTVLGREGMEVNAGTIYVSPADNNMEVINMPNGDKRLSLAPATTLLKPSVDILMESVALTYGPGCLGIILTGMGKDGLEGMRAIKANGGTTIVQDKSSSVVYGMAQAVNEEHLADSVLPLVSIPSAIMAWSDTHED